MLCIMARTFFVLSALLVFAAAVFGERSFIHLNQIGFLPDDRKSAIVLADGPIDGSFVVKDGGGKIALRGQARNAGVPAWGETFSAVYELDLSPLRTVGEHTIELSNGTASRKFAIGDYPEYHEDLLHFMRQQRCGYNPWFETACHRSDGRTFFAPVPDETYVDVSGGWHDAGDQLKYLITSSNAAARMLSAFEMQRNKFTDIADELGREGRPNGIPDILDEAKWGLDWIHKMHPRSDWLFHQVADDRDHRGFKRPEQDNADYGWGANSYRPAYFANGKPQGLTEFKSRATGVANIAGRSAAAMAIGHRVWKAEGLDAAFALKCLKAAETLYQMGKRQEGFQQGNSYGAPYRYNEITWADDMEWAAAELYKATKDKKYLNDAIRYAKLAGTTSWMEYETDDMGPLMERHYEMYPFTNFGHFALYPLVDKKTKAELVGYYRSGIERVVARSRTNPYGIGIPFIWCSNNLAVAFITQVLLYEEMTGDRQFHGAMIAHRDWLFGRNPWGTSMFEGIPAGGEFPTDTHLPSVQLLKRQVPGGLVDGPIAARTHKGLIGLTLTQPDEFAIFQPKAIFYHDDVGDYATNEPTMDGTADAIFMMALHSRVPDPRRPYQRVAETAPARAKKAFTVVRGGIIRGDTSRKEMSLVFTGDEFAEGGTIIADALKKHGIKASFFFTGRFYRTRANHALINRLRGDGHYLGPHSDEHLLYADWNDRSKTLVTRDEFEKDLIGNYSVMRPFGIARRDAPFFLPPFEWYNDEIAAWTSSLGSRLINFTPGTRSNADYTGESDKNFVASDAILKSIYDNEAKDPNGLNGFILLTHIGAGPKRTDKFHVKIDELLGWLTSKGYRPVRVDELLR